ncbi:MAG: hypothetical protein NTW07_09670, partial [candidate division Zixibacteria bacterium]|nr:hypothetical protein [candidate division Zixibacteria bacterium]
MEGRLSSGNAEVSNLREQTDELLQTIHQLEESIAVNLPRQREVLSQTENLRNQHDQMVTRRSELETRRRELVSEIESGLERGEEISQELSDLKASLEACEARRQLLEDMMLHYEGYESGVVAAMDERARWPQLAGTVADKFVPSAGMESVLQAALGEMSKYLICHDRHQAEDIITYLKSQRKGRVGILVPRSGTITPAVKRPEIDLPGVVGWLDTLVTTDSSLRTLMEAVLARTLVVNSDADIDAILERLPYGFGAVSTNGVLYQKNLISGGSDDDFPLFRRAERIADQEREVEAIKAKMSVVSAEKNRNTAAIGALRAESEQTASNLEDVLQEIEELQHRLTETEYAGRTLTAEYERLNREKQNLNVRLENIRGRQYSLGLGTTELATLKENLVSDIRLAAEQLHELEQRAARATGEVSRLQIATIESRSRVEQTEHRISHMEQLIGEIDQNRIAGMAQLDQAQRDIEYADQTLATLEQDIKSAFERRDQLAHDQEELRVQQTVLMERTTAHETQVRTLRQEKEAVSERLHAADIRLTAVGSAIDAMIDRLKGEYEIDISDVVVERPREEITDEQAPALVAELKEKLKDFGAVNLLALEEYDVANEREKFLAAQLNDLTAAKNDLKSTITKINKTARDLFIETFTKVQQNFSQLFVELFAGGEARISLVTPDDPLESDIDIIARPGGKKLLPITMLSGGERALTAISLLFSLYLVKPSPFCILDEIDAPLDDANCQRFLKIIRTFSQQTQFIVITHN